MIKRLIDLLLALIALVMLAPLLVVIAVLVRLKLGSPVIFRQQRPGLGGRLFEMYKFRTMSESILHDGSLKPDADRLTGFGSLLRATSLDELPELWNILKGDMSLVGPRPLLPQYLPLYNNMQKRRHEVRPGITGWAQVNGRNAISWEQRFEFDVWYVDNRSLWLDLRIVMMTIIKVVRREGISSDGEATMLAFTGSVNRESDD